MALIDYKDRVYDVMAFQDVKRFGDAPLTMALFDAKTGGTIGTGSQKLAQRWILEFLTEVGSMPGLPNRGTEFMTRVRQGRIRTYNDVSSNFIFSELSARLNLQQEEADDWPLEERISSAELVSVEFAPGYANLKVELISLAGDARQVILPIATLPQNIG